MKTYRINGIRIPLGGEADIKSLIAETLGLDKNCIHNVELLKRSVDARKKPLISFILNLAFEYENTILDDKVAEYIRPKNLLFFGSKSEHFSGKAVIIGSGPCGMFCAMYLTASGFRPILIEKGSDTLIRRDAIERFHRTRVLDSDNNVQFGLGGAGTFSDGKLTTGVNSPALFTVFDTFKRFGAPPEIMYEANAHIGTDYLVNIVRNMAEWLSNNGCDLRLNTTMTDIVVENGAIRGVEVVENGISKLIECDKVVMACGHSSRDVYKMLLRNGIAMERKPFSMGVRIEHTRESIDLAQYGFTQTHRDLSAADYKMAVHLPNGRSVYTFCMCPGGEVVCASSAEGEVVTNGMSRFARNAANSNSAVLVNVTPDDFPEGDVLSGIELQGYWERKAYSVSNDYSAPCQNVRDFLGSRRSSEWDVKPSYPLGVVSADLRDYLPDFVSEGIRQALPQFARKVKGFDSCGIMTAIESRSSSPVRIIRDSQAECSVKGLYAGGEGAGYAGGIVSAAIDGLNIGMKIAESNFIL
ncbi:MAG: hypothetical protein PHX51_06950 [Clostridia bacterium]|nr:hypothetical protein [Clostridia bacterium]